MTPTQLLREDRKLNRKISFGDLSSLVRELHGNEIVEEHNVEHKLREITREINSLKRKLASLEKQKVELLEIHNN